MTFKSVSIAYRLQGAQKSKSCLRMTRCSYAEEKPQRRQLELKRRTPTAIRRWRPNELLATLSEVNPTARQQNVNVKAKIVPDST